MFFRLGKHAQGIVEVGKKKSLGHVLIDESRLGVFWGRSLGI